MLVLGLEDAVDFQHQILEMEGQWIFNFASGRGAAALQSATAAKPVMNITRMAGSIALAF